MIDGVEVFVGDVRVSLDDAAKLDHDAFIYGAAFVRRAPDGTGVRVPPNDVTWDEARRRALNFAAETCPRVEPAQVELHHPTGVLDGVDAAGYDGVWRAWKLASLGLFAAFVACAVDIAVSLRKHTAR